MRVPLQCTHRDIPLGLQLNRGENVVLLGENVYKHACSTTLHTQGHPARSAAHSRGERGAARRN